MSMRVEKSTENCQSNIVSSQLKENLTKSNDNRTGNDMHKHKLIYNISV